jgi:MSHA biogenesis protein MshP
MRRRRAQAGISLISAIFLIVMLMALAAAMVSLSEVQHDTSTKSLLSAKAYYGARAGIEWATQQAVAAGSCAGATWGPAPASNPMQGALSDVTVTVTCTPNGAPYGAGNFVYYLQSTATVGTINTPGYAERHVSATISNIP